LVISGGVACNTTICQSLLTLAYNNGFKTYIPSKRLCRDNAIMISWAGIENYNKGMNITAPGEKIYYDPTWKLDPSKINYFPLVTKMNHPKKINPLNTTILVEMMEKGIYEPNQYIDYISTLILAKDNNNAITFIDFSLKQLNNDKDIKKLKGMKSKIHAYEQSKTLLNKTNT